MLSSVVRAFDQLGLAIPSRYPAELDCPCGGKLKVYLVSGYLWFVCGHFFGGLPSWLQHIDRSDLVLSSPEWQILIDHDRRQRNAVSFWKQCLELYATRYYPIPSAISDYYYHTILEHNLFDTVLKYNMLGLIIPGDYAISHSPLSIAHVSFVIPHWVCENYIAGFSFYGEESHYYRVDSTARGISNYNLAQQGIPILISSPFASIYFTAVSLKNGYRYVFCSPGLGKAFHAPFGGYFHFQRAALTSLSDRMWQPALEAQWPIIFVKTSIQPSLLLKACRNFSDPVETLAELLQRYKEADRKAKWDALPLSDLTRNFVKKRIQSLVSIPSSDPAPSVPVVLLPNGQEISRSFSGYYDKYGKPASDFTVECTEVISYPSGEVQARLRYFYGSLSGEILVPYNISSRRLFDIIAREILRKTGQRPWISSKARRFLSHIAFKFGSPRQTVIHRFGWNTCSLILPGATWSIYSGWQKNDYHPSFSGIFIPRYPDPLLLQRSFFGEPDGLGDLEKQVIDWIVESTISLFKYGWSWQLAVPDLETALYIADLFLFPRTSLRVKLGSLVSAMQGLDWPIVVTNQKIPIASLWPNVGTNYRLIGILKEKPETATGWRLLPPMSRCRSPEAARSQLLSYMFWKIDASLTDIFKESERPRITFSKESLEPESNMPCPQNMAFEI